jgi:hypothetical protein
MGQSTSGSDAAFNSLLTGYQAAARRRLRAVDPAPCHFCRTPPSLVRKGADFDSEVYVYSEVGRVDNASGFSSDNSVPCCEVCCRVKAVVTYAETVEWLQRLIAHQALRDVELPGDMFGRES